MRPEVSLLAVYLILFMYDLVTTGHHRRMFHPLACTLTAALVILTVSDMSSFTLFGGMYESNAITAVMKSILAFGSLLAILQAHKWLRNEHTFYKQGEFYILLLSTLLGMFFMMSARHFLLLFIGIELASLPLACLVAFDKYRHNSAEAGIKYILTSMFASAMMLYGISFLYGTTGSLYFADMIPAISGTPMQIFAFVMFFSGLGFKISLVPFHLWTADSYQGAPTTVTAYLSVISKGAAVFTLFVVLVKVFAPMIEQWQTVIYITIVASITIANLMAIKQHFLKRFMAFSSISQAGYIMLAVIGGKADGMTAMVFYLLVYLVANMAVFAVIESLEWKIRGAVRRETCNGLYRTNPRLTLVMTLALFSLAGIPPFAGFFSKFFVFMSAFGTGFWVLVFIALVNTVISLYYYLLIVKAMYMEPNEHPVEPFKCDPYIRIELLICVAGIILLGICSFVYSGIDSISFGL
jgi:NADH-quinone oxidoreductase subunit N